MLINKPKPGEHLYWMTLKHEVFCDDTLVASNYPTTRIHSGKVISYDSKNCVVKLEVLVSDKFLKNPSYFTTGVERLPTYSNGGRKLKNGKAHIGMPTDKLYGSMVEIKLALVKFITNDFDTDEIR